MPHRFRLLLRALALLLFSLPILPTADAAGTAWSPRGPEYEGVVVEKDVPIVLGDGTVLSADVHRPASADGKPAQGRFPTLVLQTAYGKDAASYANEYLVRRGYVDVVVDQRGTGASSGVYVSPFSAQEQRDSYDIVQWASEQGWSNGKVGLHGASLMGINQLLTAAQQPPALRAIFPMVPHGDAFRTAGGTGDLSVLFPIVLKNPVSPPPGYTADDPERAAAALAGRPAGVASNDAPSDVKGSSEVVGRALGRCIA